jgi:hypothetical protein
MLYKIIFINKENEKKGQVVDLPSDDMNIIEEYLTEQLGYYPNSVDILLYDEQ